MSVITKKQVRQPRPITRRNSRLVVGSASVLAALLLWELAVRGPLSTISVPTVLEIGGALSVLMIELGFWAGVWATITQALVGLLVAALVGVPLGMFLGRNALAFHMARAPMEFLKVIPPIVVLPLAIMVLGPTFEMSVFVVFFGCVFMLALQTMAGVLDIDPAILTMAKSYRMNRTFTLVHVALPATLPYIVTGLRIATASALIIAVGAEMIGGAPGLGKDMYLLSSAGDIAGLYAYITFLGLLGLGLNQLLMMTERRILQWHSSVRESTRA